MIQSAINEQIRSEISRLDYLISDTGKKLGELETLGPGTLTCMRQGFNSIAYYLNQKTEGGRRVRYIGTPDSEIVQSYKKRYFFRKLLEILTHNKKVLEKALRQLWDYSVEAIHEHLPNAYKFLPKQCYVDERVLELNEWSIKTYKRNSWKLPDNPTTACDGTEVRSKGEALIYDNLCRMNIPFQYDSVHTFYDSEGMEHMMSPDFLFQCRNGRFIILEHFGKLGDIDYAERNGRKLHEYLKCGFVISDNLFLTSDNREHNTNELMILDVLEVIKRKVLM